MASLPLSILFFLCTFTLFAISGAIVPASKTFKYVNQGDFGEYIVEYDASYRVLDVATFPFQLCFYNTTPNAYYLALRMGSRRSESLMRWVWDANRGNPVRENATLTFGQDGNLVLADADGRVVWSTNTANKGVVGLRLLNNGNLVLHDKNRKYVWQSFDHPTDTLLVGQALRASGPTKLVSRASEVDGSEGAYSLVMEPRRLAMYLKSSTTPLLYYTDLTDFRKPLTLYSLKFASEPETDEGYAYELRFDIGLANGSDTSVVGGTRIWGRPKYNSTLSLLKLGYDGNLKTFTYYDKVDYGAWEATSELFSRDGWVSECLLPSRCGSLGVCEDDQCVACPRPQGLLGWSKGCVPPKLPPCNSRKSVDFYQVVGVESFLTKYAVGKGPLKVEECKNKCSKDCSCVGFFYWKESSKCWLAPVLDTLVKVSNSSHLAFIMVAK